MINKKVFVFFLSFTFCLFFSSFFSVAQEIPQEITLIEPLNENTPIDCYFTWSISPKEGVDFYGINLLEKGELWVEIRTTAISCGESFCSFPALAFAAKGSPLNYNTKYEWQIVAYDQGGNTIDSSFTGYFTTVSPEEPPPPPPVGPVEFDNPLNQGSLWEAIDALINFLFVLSLAVAPILLIYAGFTLLTKAGSPEATAQAKKIITWTLIGLSVVLFAKGVPSIVIGVLGR